MTRRNAVATFGLLLLLTSLFVGDISVAIKTIGGLILVVTLGVEVLARVPIRGTVRFLQGLAIFAGIALLYLLHRRPQPILGNSLLSAELILALQMVVVGIGPFLPERARWKFYRICLGLGWAAAFYLILPMRHNLFNALGALKLPLFVLLTSTAQLKQWQSREALTASDHLERFQARSREILAKFEEPLSLPRNANPEE